MTRPLRRAHSIIWLVVSVSAALILAASIWGRP